MDHAERCSRYSATDETPGMEANDPLHGRRCQGLENPVEASSPLQEFLVDVFHGNIVCFGWLHQNLIVPLNDAAFSHINCRHVPIEFVVRRHERLNGHRLGQAALCEFEMGLA